MDSNMFEGGCHCRKVRFRVFARTPRALECNCSICVMKGFLHLIVPATDFELLAGEDALTSYRFNTRIAHHRFCRYCGIHPFYTPRSHPDQVDVNVNCLDRPDGVHPRSLVEVEAFDGSHWEQNVETIR